MARGPRPPWKQLLIAAVVGMLSAGGATALYAVPVFLLGRYANDDVTIAFCAYPLVLALAAVVSGRLLRRLVDQSMIAAKTTLATPAWYQLLVVAGGAALLSGPSALREQGFWESVGIFVGLSVPPSLLLTFFAFRSPRPAHDNARKLVCRKCGYDLTGNVSGRCPECGSDVADADGGIRG